MSNETINTTTQGAETPTAAVDPKVAIQADIKTIKSAIADLEAKGKDLFAEEIANLNAKLKNAEAELESLADDAQQLVSELKTYEKSFAQKYGQDIAHGVEIVLMVAILGKLFGVI